MANTYYIGSLVRSTAAFKVGTALTDPTTIKFLYKDPAGATSSYTYPDPHVLRDTTGTYSCQIAVAYSGVYQVRWVGTGACEAAVQDHFVAEEVNV